MQFFAEGFTLLVAGAVVGYATWFMWALVFESIHYGDVSAGIVPIALWIPQSAAACGVGLLWISIMHTFVDLLQANKPILTNSDEV